MIRAAVVVDGTGAAPLTKQQIVIEHGLIKEVRDDDGANVDMIAEMVTPGLVLTALPVLADDELRALVARGVTSVEMVASDVRPLVALRDRIGVGRNRGPRVVVGASVAAAESVQAMRLAVRRVAELSAEVAHLTFGEGVQEALCAFIDETHAQDMQAIVTVDGAASLEMVRDCASATVIWRSPQAPHLDPEPLREAPEVIVDVQSALPSAAQWQAVAGLVGLSYDAKLLSAQTYNTLLTRPALPREVTIRALTSGPASALGLQDALGRVAPNHQADLVLSTTTGEITHVLIEGIPQHLGPPTLRERFLGWLD